MTKKSKKVDPFASLFSAEFLDDVDDVMDDTTKERKLDIFKQVLPALDKNNKAFYRELSPAQQKEFSAWLVMRWLSASSTSPEHYLLMTNDVVNCSFNALTKHPELQWMLMALCGAGSTQRHVWIKPPRKKGKNKLQEELSKFYPTANNSELKLLEQINGQESLRGLFEDAGYPDQEIEKIFS